VRELPEEQNREQEQCLQIDGCSRARPSYERRHSSGERPEQRAKGRTPLERRVNHEIAQESRDREQGREPVHQKGQIKSAADTQESAENEGLTSANSARRQRPVGG